jgi:hypothetical protein
MHELVCLLLAVNDDTILAGVIHAILEDTYFEAASCPFIPTDYVPKYVLLSLLNSSDHRIDLLPIPSSATELNFHGVSRIFTTDYVARLHLKLRLLLIFRLRRGNLQILNRFFGLVLIDAELYGLVINVRADILAFLSHDLLYICASILKPAQIICNQMQTVATLTSEQHYSLQVGVLIEGARLFCFALCARVCHQH